MKLFYFYLEQSHRLYDFEAIKALKVFIDFILGYVLVMVGPKEWTKDQMMKYDILRNAWVFEVIHRCIGEFDLKEDGEYVRKDTMTSKSSTSSHITKTIEEYHRLHSGICSVLRNSVEKIGFLLYKLDNFSIFPTSIEQ